MEGRYRTRIRPTAPRRAAAASSLNGSVMWCAAPTVFSILISIRVHDLPRNLHDPFAPAPTLDPWIQSLSDRNVDTMSSSR